jgi:hypothetical protein
LPRAIARSIGVFIASFVATILILIGRRAAIRSVVSILLVFRGRGRRRRLDEEA